jgi:sporulation protein YlmC with PRC-barrel domain
VIALSDLIGRDVVSLRTAERSGQVEGIVVDGNRVAAVRLHDASIRASTIRSFDGDVLTFDADRLDEGDRAARGIDPRGSRVLDIHGDLLGTISDLGIAADGAIETIVLDAGRSVPGARLQALGAYAAVLSDELPPPTGRPVGQSEPNPSGS